MSMDYFDTDLEKDIPRERTKKVSNGNEVYFKFTDPYGFITVNFKKGQMPKNLAEASWTNYDSAVRDVANYLKNKGYVFIDD